MLQIQNITTDGTQKQSFVLPDGSSLELVMYFSSLQQGWFIKSLKYNDFELNGMRITVNPNMLFQWKNLLPFGLACFSVGNREPSQQEDFSSGAATLYILTVDEVEAYASSLNG